LIGDRREVQRSSPSVSYGVSAGALTPLIKDLCLSAQAGDTMNTKNSNQVAIQGLRITRDLHETEAAIDEALIRQANLLATMVRARRETSVGAFTGQEALLRLVASQKSMLDASNDIARVHGQLLEVGREMGSGMVDDCPERGALPVDAQGVVTLARAS